MLLNYLINVYKSFYLINPLILVYPLYFINYIIKVTSKGISPREPVLLNGCFIVGVLLRVTCTLAKSLYSKTLVYKRDSFSKLVYKVV
jgi:hypothetical protein